MESNHNGVELVLKTSGGVKTLEFDSSTFR